MGEQAYYKSNPATQLFDRVVEMRQLHGMRGTREQGYSAPPEPAHQTINPMNAPLGADGDVMPMVSPLNPQEIAERNARWEQETGQRLDANNNIVAARPSDDEDIPAPEYSPDSSAAIEARHMPKNTVSMGAAYRAPSVRAIDFSKMESIRFVDSVVVVDGISFKMNDIEKAEAAVFAANIIRHAMESQIIEGLKTMGLQVAVEGTNVNENVRDVQADAAPKQLREAPAETGWATKPLSDV